MPDRPFIRDLEPAKYIEGVYAIQNGQLATTRTGSLYLKCLLADKTGRTPGRMWSMSEEQFATLPTDGFVHIRGQTQPYQGEMQVIIQAISGHDPTDDELAFLLPATDRDVDEMFSQVMGMLQSLEHPAIQTLRDRYLEDRRLMEDFCQAPAAKALHHAYLGGLLEHTLSLMTLADAMLPNYPDLNRDIVLFALFLHDLGKCVELRWRRGFDYTDDGHLLGHLVRGSLMLQEKARLCEDPELGDAAMTIPEPILLVLHHIIISHHGQPEFGAAKLPSTPEAIFISALDNLDAKVAMALAATRGGEEEKALGSRFTERMWALDTRLYRPDPTTLDDADAVE